MSRAQMLQDHAATEPLHRDLHRRRSRSGLHLPHEPRQPSQLVCRHPPREPVTSTNAALTPKSRSTYASQDRLPSTPLDARYGVIPDRRLPLQV